MNIGLNPGPSEVCEATSNAKRSVTAVIDKIPTQCIIEAYDRRRVMGARGMTS